ncbi:MAG: AsmA family protein [Muribaculaceae bacterium]|nr:AsmA family protein [Muribaculaceae bacterium]
MRRLLKIFGLVILAIVLLAVAAITVAVNYLKPERLTPLVERMAGEYLDAEIALERVEISFYSTFPRFVLDVRGLEVRTKAFENLPAAVRGSLPQCADSLLSLEGLNGSVNIPRLLSGTIELYDISLSNPRINLVQATPEVSGLDIFPTSDEKKDNGPLSIPDFSFSHFRVDSMMAVRYISLPDSIDVTVGFRTLSLAGTEAPLYAVEISGRTSASLPSLRLPETPFGLDGRVGWSSDRPLDITLDGMRLCAGDVTVDVSTEISLETPMTIRSLDINLPLTPVKAITDLFPKDMTGGIEAVDAAFDISLRGALTAPYRLEGDSLPSLNLVVEIPEKRGSYLRYDGMRIDRFALLATAEIDGGDLDRSTLVIERIMAQGEGMGFALEGRVTNPLTDPTVSGIFKGRLNFSRLPKRLLSAIPGTVKGQLRADCSFDLHRSWLTADRFHLIRLQGEANVTDLDVEIPEYSFGAYSRRMQFRLGTSSSFTRGEQTVDSLLTASIKADTLSCDLPGMEIRASEMALGLGCRNTDSSSDTTQVNPIGGRLTLGRLSLNSETDSLRLYLRKGSAGISLRRFRGDGRRPQLSLSIAADRAFYADALNRALLSEAFAGVTVYPSTSAANMRRLARLDSLRRENPGLSRDSLLALDSRLRAERRKSLKRTDTDTLPAQAGLEVDGSLRRLLRQWETRGRMHAARVVAFTPLFPLRSRVTDLSMRFNSDSVTIEDTRIRVGRSDFVLDGTISNITRALTSRNGSQPLHLNFEMRSDTIDVNQIAAAVFAGAAHGERNAGSAAGMTNVGDEMTDESVGPSGDAVSDTAMAVLIIPANVEATLSVSASNIIYSDLIFRNFKGVLNAYEGALNLSELTAHTDVGSVNLNALYSASSIHDATFAFGLRIKDFHIKEFLDLVPSIDSLMPLLKGIRGVINADLAATTAVDSAMNIDIPTLKAAVKISGDSLVVIDDETFRTIGKWLLFKQKNRNMIDSMTVEMIVDNSQLQMFPFVFNLDRYKLGVSGSNDMAMNFDYHIAVLKSPLPFKFGVNISGKPDDMKIRLGRAKFNEKNMARTVSIADTARVNLVNEIRNVFRRGVRRGRMKRLDFTGVSRELVQTSAAAGDTISHADSLYFIREGVLPPQPTPDSTATQTNKPKNRFFRR